MLKSILVAAILAVPTVCLAADYDLLIRGGKVIDGSGNAWYYADLGIKGQRIASIGDLSKRTGKKEINAKGAVVTPGFIDVHTHTDADIFNLPLAENFIRDGVTTIVSGNCGGSVLDVGAFFERIEKQPAAVNHATLYGHNTVLRELKGGSVIGKLTDEQLAEGKAMVAKAMDDGAIGFATGLIYTPGKWSDTEEIIELAKPAGAAGGIYASHMRNEGVNILQAIDEALRIGKESGCRVQISHFKLPTIAAVKLGRGTKVEAGSDISLAKVMEARAAGFEVWVDQYPYTASSTTLNVMLPDWVLENGVDEAKKTLAAPANLKKVLDDMRRTHEVSNNRTDMSYAVVANASGRPELAGKNIKQIAQLRKFKEQNDGKEPELLGGEGLPDVTMEDQYRTIIDIFMKGSASCVYHSMDETEVANIMKNPLVGIASDSGVRRFNSGMPHPRGYGTNARVLGRYVRELNVITFEEAIRKMTSMPATAFRMKDRGTIRVGAFADINIIDPEQVKDLATFENPHQYSVGFKSVIVNGTEVFDGEKMTGEKSGLPIKGPGAKQ